MRKAIAFLSKLIINHIEADCIPSVYKQNYISDIPTCFQNTSNLKQGTSILYTYDSRALGISGSLGRPEGPQHRERRGQVLEGVRLRAPARHVE